MPVPEIETEIIYIPGDPNRTKIITIKEGSTYQERIQAVVQLAADSNTPVEDLFHRYEVEGKWPFPKK